MRRGAETDAHDQQIPVEVDTLIRLRELFWGRKSFDEADIIRVDELSAAVGVEALSGARPATPLG